MISSLSTIQIYGVELA